ncbi:TatD family hydrolase [Candidatus Peregrinibacteria bacterium]|nr:TatD family hydrolase [Candidatus Peregrinibacteria bacterium]
MIDSHCHLTDKIFEGDLNDVLVRAKEAGVERMVTISDRLEEGTKCIEISKKYENVFATVGVHPHNAKEWQVTNPAILKKLVQSSKKVVGIGEIGLDYHYMHSPKDIQKKVFREQLQLGKELGLPVVVHTREAIEDTWAIVDDIRPEKIVIHCCCEKFEDIVRFLERGYLASFTGLITYPKAEELRRTVQMCSLDQIMIETDAPYLAPKKFRGKRNEPAYVVEVAKMIAEVKGVSLEEVDRVTTANTVGFYGLPAEALA